MDRGPAMASVEIDDRREEPASGEIEENSPVPQVAMTVPVTDDTSLPVYTFRMWVLGSLSCVVLSFLNQFFFYRSSPLSISAISAQIAVVPLGHLMARVLPTRRFLKGSRFEFTLNPGPFNVKEHVLITIFANSGAGGVYGMHIVTAVKAFYKKEIGFFVSFLVQLTTQILGFGWAGIFRKYLVLPAEMWWPSNLIQVSLFGALHEKDKRPKGSLSRNQFFLVVLISSFAYYLLPGYLFMMLTSLSFVCWARPNSVLSQQLGSGSNGLGLGSFALDWATAASYLGSPLASPWFATANVLAGYLLIMYVVVPVSYWYDIFKAKTFPIYSAGLFNSTGQRYNIDSIINDRFQLDEQSYDRHGPLYISTFFAMTYGVGFATLTATVVHVALFHGRDIIAMTRSALSKQKIDVHTRLMSRYKQVPESWFTVILIASIALALLSCHFFKETLQLPLWGVLLACFIAFFFTLPIGIINATTNQAPGLNIITEYIIGYLYPGRPVANVLFKVYGYISMAQALTFLADFKLGHYMKIPPRAMFTAQLVGTVIAVLVYLVTGWWLLETVPDICVLKEGNQWTCPADRTFYDASVIWGLVGPQRIFGNLGNYSSVNWFFLAGAIAPAIVYAMHRLFPEKKWIRLINMPVLLGATAMMPPASAINYITWLVMAFVSGYVVLRRYPNWWKRNNYVLSGALDAGVGFMGVLLYFALQSKGIGIDWWGNNPDGCPLATCPTAPGVVVDGCPVPS